jgi:hypothetical protein
MMLSFLFATPAHAMLSVLNCCQTKLSPPGMAIVTLSSHRAAIMRAPIDAIATYFNAKSHKASLIAPYRGKIHFCHALGSTKAT